jgi:hypothetical protein
VFLVLPGALPQSGVFPAFQQGLCVRSSQSLWLCLCHHLGSIDKEIFDDEVKFELLRGQSKNKT